MEKPFQKPWAEETEEFLWMKRRMLRIFSKTLSLILFTVLEEDIRNTTTHLEDNAEAEEEEDGVPFNNTE